ncbi:hypothetical protein PVAP13_6NG352300 [Panicum virgatum]|uniref:Uncharacterized protein n=1 Tax=Panicum virgatum TaxID=38727 RepID=A0A8T0R5W1_PANVG|nr:hypothetical protein PVAP13_6NG352300 [Panicum virgatum]KAG2580527.1 hypothetical protein PVAP13_6NG352300 [Panicum virgatum]KAG2580528.1 hypothetical protein PVAP13_6NG352300 [Panicum virgatum]
MWQAIPPFKLLEDADLKTEPADVTIEPADIIKESATDLADESRPPLSDYSRVVTLLHSTLPVFYFFFLPFTLLSWFL